MEIWLSRKSKNILITNRGEDEERPIKHTQRTIRHELNRLAYIAWRTIPKNHFLVKALSLSKPVPPSLDNPVRFFLEVLMCRKTPKWGHDNAKVRIKTVETNICFRKIQTSANCVCKFVQLLLTEFQEHFASYRNRKAGQIRLHFPKKIK